MPSPRPLARHRHRRFGPIAGLGACGLLLALLSITGGCATALPVADARPADLPDEALAPAAWLGMRTVSFRLEPGEGDAMEVIQVERLGSATGILLGEDLLLTNAHVWAEDHELAERRTFLLHRPLLGGPPAEHTFELVASRPQPGDHRRSFDEIGEAGERPDWALARCLDGRWAPGEAARLHPRAADPTWRPAPGTELLVVGYSPIFLPGSGGRDDALPPPPPPRTLLELAERRTSSGPFVIRGRSVTFRSEHCLTYPASWPSPVGHSGGPVFVRDPADGELLLVGVFHTRLRLTPRNDEGDVLSLLEFDPIAEVLEGSGLDPTSLRAAETRRALRPSSP
jgi:hypothetical protein